jgi:dihydroorotase
VSKPDTVIQNATWRGESHDLLLSGGVVLELRPSAGGQEYADAEIVDAKGMQLLPALIDVHTHLREPGFEWKETVATGLTAAAHGGFGTVMCMANTDPVNDCAAVTEQMLDKARAAFPQGGPRLFPIGALTMGLKGRELAPMGELRDAGCRAVSNDGLPVENSELFRRAVEYASDFGLTVIDHCEDPHMALGTGINEGVMSARLGLKGQPTVAESLQVARDILLAEYLNLPIHIAHVSCRESVELIRAAKERGVPVTAETCPHYLMFTEEAVEGYDTAAKVNPPLRPAEHVEVMRQALRDGVIDMLATDHAPHAAHEKEEPFSQAPNGISGFDTALSATMQLVDKGVLEIDHLIRAWTTAPAKAFGLPVNTFAPGDPADFVLYDREEFWVVSPGSMHSKGKNTPLSGQTMLGRTAALYVEGRRVV